MIENIVLGLGSNIGDRLGYLNRAVKEISLTPGFNFLAVSSVYETEPWGYKNQGKFLNSVLVCLCRYEPMNALRYIKDAEKRIGRIKRRKWHEREIDIDILFYSEKPYSRGNLKIPHQQIPFRNFVLAPLEELMPGFTHPVLNKKIDTLYRNSKDINKVTLYKIQE